MRCDIHVCSDFFSFWPVKFHLHLAFLAQDCNWFCPKVEYCHQMAVLIGKMVSFGVFKISGGTFLKSCLKFSEDQLWRSSAGSQAFFSAGMVETCWKPQQKEWDNHYQPISHMIGFLQPKTGDDIWWRIGSLGVRLVSCSTGSILAKSAETGFHQFDPKQNWLWRRYIEINGAPPWPAKLPGSQLERNRSDRWLSFIFGRLKAHDGFREVFLHLKIHRFTIWLFNISMENGPFIDDVPIKTSIYKGFSMAMLNNQMVSDVSWLMITGGYPTT